LRNCSQSRKRKTFGFYNAFLIKKVKNLGRELKHLINDIKKIKRENISNGE